MEKLISIHSNFKIDQLSTKAKRKIINLVSNTAALNLASNGNSQVKIMTMATILERLKEIPEKIAEKSQPIKKDKMVQDMLNLNLSGSNLNKPRITMKRNREKIAIKLR